MKYFLMVAIIIITLCGCKPIDITDPTPVWYRMTLESSTEEFALGDIGVESAISTLEAHNVDFTKPIIVKQAIFAIEREYMTSGDILTPYILYIGDIMADTVAVDTSPDASTTSRGYYDLNKGCKDPYWRVRSTHNVRVRVDMLIYAFKE
jgi:hypothetical protein